MRVRWYFGGIFAIIVAIVGIIAFFMYSDVISRAFQSVAKIEINPDFIGGRVATRLYDPVGDDHGYGGLVYPTHKDFVPGSLDLVRCEIHEPVYDAKWTAQLDFWQIDLTFREGGAEDRNIRIYLNTENSASDSRTLPRDEQAEGVSFDSAFPWEYVVAVHGTEGRIESADKTLSLQLYVANSNNGKKVIMRIPLEGRRLQSLYSTATVNLYVLIGGWSPWGRDEFLPVARRAAADKGGGAVSSLTPAIYDYLAPNGQSQEKLLSSWNDDELTVPEIVPVTVSLRSVSTKNRNTDSVSSARIAELEKQANAEETTLAKAARTEWESAKTSHAVTADVTAELAYATLAFNANERTEAEPLFDQILSVEPDNPSALAYKGALVAMRGGEAPVLLAVELVGEAYRYLDRAVELAQTPTEIITARMNRGNVSMSVPESVFGKSLEGGEDFIAAANVFRRLNTDLSGYQNNIVEAYINAGRCFEAAGKSEDAGTWFREASRLSPKVTSKADADFGEKISAASLLELYRRGLIK